MARPRMMTARLSIWRLWKCGACTRRCSLRDRDVLILLVTHAVLFFSVRWCLPFHNLGSYYQQQEEINHPPITCPCNGAIPSSSRSSSSRENNSLSSSSSLSSSPSSIPTIFIITPTYSRLTQKVDLTSMCHTLMHVRNLHWIVVEDSSNVTPLVAGVLQRCSVPSTHMSTRSMVMDLKLWNTWPYRGNDQKNLGLDWLRAQCGAGPRSMFTERTLDPGSCENGVVYFADDDNKYDLRLFEEMRKTKKVSMWSVAFVSQMYYEGPICTKDRKVDSWREQQHWGRWRRFPIDMAGFALNLRVVLSHHGVGFDMVCCASYLESLFLVRLGLHRQDVECIGYQYSEVLVWHVKTEKPIFLEESETSSKIHLETK